MSKSQQTPRIQLPKGWKKQVRSALRHVLSLVQYAAVYSRGWAADSTNTRVRLQAELDRPSNGCCLAQRFFTTLSGGGIGKSDHPNGAYEFAGPEHSPKYRAASPHETV
jgi:hypothetical protein